MKRNIDNWFVRYHGEQNTILRLICLPYAGGGISTYSNWIDEVPLGVEVIAVQPPGRGTRFIETPFDAMQDLVNSLYNALTSLISEPYVIFGHSLGSGVGYELLKKLINNGQPLPLCFLASGGRAPHVEKQKLNINTLSDDEFKERLIKLNGTPPDILENREILDLFMPVLRADFKIADDYSGSVCCIDCPVTVLGGTDDYTISMGELLAWQDLFVKPIELKMVSGDHFFVENNVKDTLSVINSKLSEILSKIF